MGRLTLRFFGPPEVRRSDGELLPALRTRKGLWLLALLVLRAGKTVERVWLAGQLWPDAPTESGLANLRRTLTDLRRALGPDALTVCSPTHTTLSFDAGAADCDVLTFDGDPTGQLPLYKSALLEGCDEEWVFAERRQREERYIEARLALARGAPRDEAYEHLKALLDTAPFHEEALRRLMELGMQLGRQSEALGIFRAFRERLSAQRLVLDPRTQALYVALQAKLRQPAPPPIRPKWAESAPLRLPQPPTAFVGRREEQAELVHLLLYEPLVTILGMGGLGKTRLALRVAEELSGEFPDGAAFVELATLPASDTLLTTVTTVGRSLGQRCESLKELVAALASQRLLLVLDNAEHVLPACRALVQALRQECPQLAFLITSREPLELPGEVHWRLEPLGQNDSHQLFVQCAGRARPGVALEPETLANLCQQLEGIPLALELAAGRLGVLTPGQLTERLTERFRVLQGGVAHPERHRTLRTVLESSWEQLASEDQLALARLSVFRGSWSLEGAVHVAFPGEDDFAALDRLTRLVSHSLLLAEAGRFRLLETVRLFAQQHLLPAERLHAETRLLTWLHALALRDSDDAQQQLWLEHLEAERANLRAALDAAVQTPELHTLGLGLVIYTGSLYRLRGGIIEARKYLTHFLEEIPRDDPEFGRGHWQAGKLAHLQGDFQTALHHYNTAKAQSTHGGLVYVLESQGLLARDQGELERAERTLQEAQNLCDAIGGSPLWCHGARAALAWLRGDYEQARALLEPTLTRDRKIKNRISLAASLLWWAKIERDLGNEAQETAALDESLTLSQEVGYTLGEVGARYGHAERLLRLGHFSASEKLASEALQHLLGEPSAGLLPRLLLVQAATHRERGALQQAEALLQNAQESLQHWDTPESKLLVLIEEGLLRQAQGTHAQATLLWGAAEALRQHHGFALPPFLRAQVTKRSPKPLSA
ncbi:NB-ARC domain-containing protein [Armatimonas sp.]|uniref:ATP-binding protein n=1 Tax=Armatimonas sp. TaxID=1872638 RepID=UPI00286D61C0|nr:NB-ARC domain-containing protein [Armatimonas sp.]